MEKLNYSCQQLVLEVESRLNLLHNVKEEFTVGKNKIVFEVNGSPVFVYKDREKTTGAKKTIVESLDMFPVVLYQSNGDKYSESDVEKLTAAIDHYYIDDVIKANPKFALCNTYHYIKNGLLPFFDTFEPDEAQTFILDYCAVQASDEASMSNERTDKDAILFFFVNRQGPEQKLFIVDAGNFSLSITPIVYNGEDIYAENYKDEDLREYVIKYDETGDLAGSIRKIIKGYSSFDLCKADITAYVEPKSGEEDY